MRYSVQTFQMLREHVLTLGIIVFLISSRVHFQIILSDNFYPNQYLNLSISIYMYNSYWSSSCIANNDLKINIEATIRKYGDVDITKNCKSNRPIEFRTLMAIINVYCDVIILIISFVILD